MGIIAQRPRSKISRTCTGTTGTTGQDCHASADIGTGEGTAVGNGGGVAVSPIAIRLGAGSLIGVPPTAETEGSLGGAPLVWHAPSSTVPSRTTTTC